MSGAGESKFTTGTVKDKVGVLVIMLVRVGVIDAVAVAGFNVGRGVTVNVGSAGTKVIGGVRDNAVLRVAVAEATPVVATIDWVACGVGVPGVEEGVAVT